ncbi:MAG TPA: fumarylacetoacetate hydrolase family protein [Ramlibacter sp.]|nr:fumarylacetoacetate hydrolase family protein [Ramlibacter sp.]
MRLAYLVMDGRRFVGVRKGDHYVDLAKSRMRWNSGLTELLECGEAGLRAARDAAEKAGAAEMVQAQAVSFLRLNEPGCITCVGSNYAAHIRERGRPFPKEPSCFMKTLSAFAAHNEALERPANSVELDYEVELAVVIGRAGRYVPIDRALEYVAGYTIMNEGSVRDFQARYNNVALGKNFPKSGALGPELVTADELPAGAQGLRIGTRVNGVTVQDSTTSDLVFDVPMLVSLVSHTVGLRPGDIIATGTPSGVGAAREPALWLKHGDTVEMFIEGIGTLSNPVVDVPAPAGGHGYVRAAYAPKVSE